MWELNRQPLDFTAAAVQDSVRHHHHCMVLMCVKMFNSYKAESLKIIKIFQQWSLHSENTPFFLR